MNTWRKILAGIGLCLVLSPVNGQGVDEEKEKSSRALEELVVTATMRVSQGGSRDINFFRGEVGGDRIPRPEAFTAEGLMASYDLQLPSANECAQLFCIVGEAMPFSLPAQPEAEVLVGLGFASNVDARKWRREPLNLVAVVDKSGSMDGMPLELVRTGLQEVIDHLQVGDQLSIVLYGDRSHVHLAPTQLERSTRGAMRAAVAAIVSAGSTDMESGLRLGYQIARETAPQFAGVTRLMLFTDEQPNVGNTSAEGFMGMAIAASQSGVGLTTIGVGIQFDSVLATKISSVRGGNSFFLRDKRDIEELFDRQLDTMVSELAHDVRLEVTPQAGYRVTGIYGIPGELLGWQEETTVTVTIPTVFFSTTGGGIFVALGREPANKNLPIPVLPPGDPIMKVSLSYLPLKATVPQRDVLQVPVRSGEASTAMRLGGLLINEFVALRQATADFYLRNDTKAAYRVLAEVRQRLVNANESLLADEVKLVSTLEQKFAFLSGYSSEKVVGVTSVGKLWGRWRISRTSGDEDVSLFKGDVLEFTADDRFSIERRRETDEYTDENETYRANEEQIYLDESELLFSYFASSDRLVLSRRGSRIYARRLLAEAK